MVQILRLSIFSILFFLIASDLLHAQTEVLQTQTISCTLVGDTLHSNNHPSIYIGKKLTCGLAAGQNGWYRTFSFKSPASWPILLWRDMEIKNNMDYQLDEDLRNKDKVKEFLHQGDDLVVTKIKRRGNKRLGFTFVVYLKQGKGVASINYSCFIEDAVRMGELIIPN